VIASSAAKLRDQDGDDRIESNDHHTDASSLDRFDASIGWNGSPLDLSVGLRHSTHT